MDGLGNRGCASEILKRTPESKLDFRRCLVSGLQWLVIEPTLRGSKILFCGRGVFYP